MNTVFYKYAFPTSLVFVFICFSLSHETAFLAIWDKQLGLGIGIQASYYISLIYLAVMTSLLSYYFYDKLEGGHRTDLLHTGYFILSFLLSIPMMTLIIINPFSQNIIATSIGASFLWSVYKAIHVITAK